MRIAYCTNVRLPSERAHGHQVARVSDALSFLGHDVTIFSPHRKNTVQQDYWSFHKADKKVKLEHLGTFDPIDHPLLPKVLQLQVQNVLLRKNLKQKISSETFDCVYTRTPALLRSLIHCSVPVILELHTLPNRGRFAFVRRCNACALVVCLTTPMKQELIRLGVSAKKVIVEGDAVDIERFNQSLPPKKHDIFTVGYAGSLRTMGHDKGVGLIIDAVKLLRAKGIQIHKKIAGGPASAIHDPDYVGHLEPGLLPEFYASCDVLIYPAPKSKHPYFVRDTSPLKIFEYMAAARPIIAADLPPIRDILDESTAYFFTPGDSEDLVRVIEEVQGSYDEAAKKAVLAKEKVQNYTWEKRMKRILDALHR